MVPEQGLEAKLQFLKSKKIGKPHHYLVVGLLVFLVGFGLVWFFQGSLLSLFNSQTYSVVTFDSKGIQKLKTGDTLTGKGIPDSTIQLFFTPGNLKYDIKTDQDGNWSYKISSLGSGQYNFSVVLLDQENNLVSIKSYRVEVGSFDLVEKIKSVFTPKKASAQTGEYGMFVTEPWAYTLSHQFGIQAVVKDNQLTLYDQTTDNFQNKFCQTGCLKPDFTTEELVNSYNQDASFFPEIMAKLWDNDYDPIKSLPPYFDLSLSGNNDILKYAVNNYKNNIYPRPNAHTQTLKTSIDEVTLRQFIQEVEYTRGLKRGVNEPTNYFEQFLNVTDPILSSKSFYRVIVLPKTATNEDKFNATLGIFFTYVGILNKSAMVAEGVAQAAEKVLANPNTTRIASDVKQLKLAAREPQGLPFEVAQGRFSTWQQELEHGDSLWASLRAQFEGNLKLTNNLPRMTDSEKMFLSTAKSLFDSGDAFIVKRELTGKLIYDSKNYLLSAENGKLSHLAPSDGELNDWIDRGLVLVVKNDAFRNIEKEGTAVAFGRIVLLSEDLALRDPDTYEYLMTHEFAHVLSYMNGLRVKKDFQTYGHFFTYSQDQDKKYGKLMTVIFELATDLYTSKIKGTSWIERKSGYFDLYSKQHDALIRIKNRLASRNSNFTEADLYEFALDGGDDLKLVNKIIGKRADQLSVDEFLRIFEEFIGPEDFRWILYQYDLYYKIAEYDKIEALKKLTPFGVGSTTVIGMTAYFISSTHPNEQIPEDPVIIYPPPITDQMLEDPPSGTITQIDGSTVPGGTVEVNSVYTQGGVYLIPTGYETTYTLEADNSQGFRLVQEALAQVIVDRSKILPGGEHCNGPCKVTIPANTSPGKYKITAFVVNKSTGQVVDSDSYPIQVVSSNQGPKKVTSIKLGFQNLDLNNPQPASFSIKDNPFVTAEVKFTDGSNKLITLKFEANPNSPTPVSGVPTPVPTLAVSNPQPVTINAPVPGTTWSGKYGVDALSCGDKTCKPINVRAECVGGKVLFYWTRMDNATYDLRIDDLSNSWPDLSTDIIRNGLQNEVGYQTPTTPNFQVSSVKIGQKFHWWIHVVSTKGVSDPIDGPPLECREFAPTPNPVSSAEQPSVPAKNYPVTMTDIKATCKIENGKPKVLFSWDGNTPQGSNSIDHYAIRINMDPPDDRGASFTPGQNGDVQNDNTGYSYYPSQIAYESQHGFRSVLESYTIGGNPGHLYSWWVHPVFQDNHYADAYHGPDVRCP